MKIENDTVLVDLAAERLLAAERGEQKIAVEIKTFLGNSVLHDVEVALGQYNLYLIVMEVTNPERVLYLAISTAIYDKIMDSPISKLALQRFNVRLIVVDLETERIVEWIE